MPRIALIAALSLVVTPLSGFAMTAKTPAAANIVTPLFGSSSEPIDISSDNSEQFREERRAVWSGNVEVIQGASRLKTPRLTVFYSARNPSAPKPTAGDPASDIGHIQRVEAEGPVYYVTPTQRAKGDHGTYLGSDDTITLTGNVILVQDKNVATGDKAVIEQKTGHSILTSNPRPTDAVPKQRVRAVLYPEPNQTSATAALPAHSSKPAGPQ